MFGPALNKHLRFIIPLVEKKKELAAKGKIESLLEVLVNNGGDAAKR